MNSKSGIIRYADSLLLFILWIGVVSAPVFIFQDADGFDWRRITAAWLSLLPFLALFIINNFLLIPVLLFKGQKRTYLISVILLVIIFCFGLHFFEKMDGRSKQHNTEFRPPPPDRQAFDHPEKSHRPPEGRLSPFPYPPYINSLLICILIIGFNTGIRMLVRWSKLEQDQTLLEKENIQNQLAFLRNQVSPHFFMNTLNNIHVLIDINTEEAKEAVIKLSKLMRHLLYDSESELVPLEKELEFIVSYINLMKLRFSEKVDITLQIPDEIPQRKIPPLLFTSFVENAFKHGVSYQEHSFIDVSFDFDNTNLHFNVKNSIHKENVMDEESGIGIENSIKRLDLIYPGSYILDIKENDNVFQLKLTIPI